MCLLMRSSVKNAGKTTKCIGSISGKMGSAEGHVDRIIASYLILPFREDWCS